jgi:hypothetical protein
MPKRPESHLTDEAAQRVLRDQLPPGWITRAQDPDYGIDFVVERVEPHPTDESATEPIGRQHAIQLKGTRSPKVSDGWLRYGLKTDHLAYYVDKAMMPVFLIVVDVPQKRAYWLFLQGYAAHLPAGWREQTTVSVQIPLTNRLDHTAAFVAAVQSGEIWVSVRQVPASLQAERERMEKLDPRFRVEITATDKGRQSVLHAREPVTIRITGPAKQMRRLLDYGGAVEFKQNELSVTGSPLFEECVRLAVMMGWTFAKEVGLRYVAEDEHGKHLGQIDCVPCRITGGMKRSTIAGTLQDSPFGVELPVRRVRGHLALAESTFNFNPQKWVGQRLLELAYFDQLHCVLGALAKGAKLRTEFVDRGNATYLGTARIKKASKLAAVAGFLEIIARAREVGRQLGLNPEFRGSLTGDDVKQINELYDLVTASPQAVPNFKIAAKVLPGALDNVLKVAASDAGALKMVGPRGFTLLGSAVELQVERTITRSYLDSTPDELRAAAATGSDVPVKWRGDDDSIMIVRRLPADNTAG